jgi:L-iditol 2-dehydrogenase
VRAVVYVGPGQLRLHDAHEQSLRPGDARVQVEGCGVCGTDVRIFNGEHQAYDQVSGRVPGHEIVGRLVEVAGDVRRIGVTVGDRVFVAPNFGCGACERCASGNENVCASTQAVGITLDGGFAEQVIVPARAVGRGNLIPISDTITPASATLIEPLACVLRGQEKAGLRLGDTVFVAGGGPAGLLHVALAKARGASLIICSEISPTRRDAAIRAGASHTIDPQSDDPSDVVKDLTCGRGLDVVIAAAPVHALQTAAVELAGRGGRVVFFAGLPKTQPTVEINSNTIHYRELTLVGTTASTNQNCRTAAQLVSEGVLALDWMVSDVMPLEKHTSAIEKVQDATALKVVLDPAAS